MTAPMRRRNLIITAAATAATSACALAFRALWLEVARTVVRRRTLRLPNWPQAFDGLRVALIGDVHAGAPSVDVARVQRIAADLRRQAPDVVLLAGDLVDAEVALGRDEAPEPVARALAAIAAPGVAVLGNHDRTYGESRVEAALRTAGFMVLEDEPLAVEVRGRRLWIAGVDDEASGDPDPAAAFAGVPADEPVIVLTHSPDVFPRIPARAALTVAGHTHGGQVAIPGLRRRVIPSRHGERYAGGHIVEGGRHLYVTTGVGTSRWPVRLGAPSEVVVLRLRSRDAGTSRRATVRAALSGRAGTRGHRRSPTAAPGDRTPPIRAASA
jgi:predicted MPP superfamily phosphohydrolase